MKVGLHRSILLPTTAWASILRGDPRNMGREGIHFNQPSSEAVDVADWVPDEEFAVYPVGARSKTLLRSPNTVPAFLVPDHRYLFKEANQRYSDQFWTEVIAYQVGCQLGVAVPPAFVAWNNQNDTCGALIEWFLDYPGEPDEVYVPGGDYMTSRVSGYERKTGKQHNVESIIALMGEFSEVLIDDWRVWWCDTFCLMP